jgi:DNA-directed RNA polymerase specialized sigma24 family protein
MLFREQGRQRAGEPRSIDQVPEPHVLPPESGFGVKHRLECLSRCLARLSAENRDLILSYYRGDKGEKIRNRKLLVQSFGIPASTLRMRALRVRETLQLCSEDCLRRQEGSWL